MNGRMENDIIKNEKINTKLKCLPSFVTEWNNYMMSSELTSSTRADYINKLCRFLSSIKSNMKEVSIDDLTKRNVDLYLGSITTVQDIGGSIKRSSDSYKQSVWCCLNNFFEFLVEYEYIKNNPINIKKKPRNNDLSRISQSRVLLTKKDFSAMLNAVMKKEDYKWNRRDRAILLVLMSTGIRKTALTEINISDIDFQQRKLSVIDKGEKSHVYYLNKGTILAIKEWIDDRDRMCVNNDALFVSYQGKRISSRMISKIVDKYSIDALGKHISPHKIRAGFCSIMYNETGDIEKVRRMVGHSNVTTTQRYIVTNNVERMEAAKIMDDLI